MAHSLIRIFSLPVAAMMLLGVSGSSLVKATPRSGSPAAPADDKLVAQGKALFSKYRCYDCHGMNGEGTDEAPDLTGTRLDADGISAFLQHPSADATNKGMPSFEKDSPDLPPLVAYVVSLKKPPSQ